ncbi:MAG: AsmA-like C-terminal region-containing protein, partial [Limnobacter sp.]|nr:AsmA-like C-terminal region-containing protein [Limnobacter sp.]
TWQYNDDLSEQTTRIDINQRVNDAGGFLNMLGNEGVFRGGSGSLVGNLSWDGPPSQFDYQTLTGSLELESKKGQFLKADPGVAKLLGVLSLQGITRRLSLDFNDLFAKGFAYDELNASVTLKDGVATTPNFKMIGPSATVLMDGSLNLAQETQNLNVVVLPDLNATGGSLIYSVVAANPAVGIASLIADFLLKDPIAKVFSLQYKVTGPWTEPDIKRLSRGTSDILEQALP